MIKFLRAFIYQTMHKHIDESKLNVKHIEIPEEKISYFNLSSNLIISFCHEGKQFYFRECPQRLGLEPFFKKEIERFFRTLNRLHINEEHFKQEFPITVDFSQDTILVFRAYIEQLERKPDFMKSVSSVDLISQKMNFSIWENRHYDQPFFDAYGLSDLPECCRDIAIYFLWCMRGACHTYRTLRVVCGKQYSYFSAVKSIASKIVADALGLNHLITSAEFCRIELEDGTSMFGVISDAAPGSRMVDSDVAICGSLQKELMDLSMLDLICVQTDHGPNNYNVSTAGTGYTVCAFDNDNPNTFLPLPLINLSLQGCSKLITSKGLVNRPFVSCGLYSSVQNFKFDRLRMQLKPYLNAVQIAALIIRIKGVQKALKTTAAQNPYFVIEDAAWNEQTVAKELSGNYGKTYFTTASKRKENTNGCVQE